MSNLKVTFVGDGIGVSDECVVVESIGGCGVDVGSVTLSMLAMLAILAFSCARICLTESGLSTGVYSCTEFALLRVRCVLVLVVDDDVARL
jgi:hypothetical protein